MFRNTTYCNRQYYSYLIILFGVYGIVLIFNWITIQTKLKLTDIKEKKMKIVIPKLIL